MDLDAFRWLLTDDGQALLARAGGAAPADDRCGPQAELRRAAAPEHVAAALTQVDAAPPGRSPSSATWPRRMYFTPDGLEQATRRPVAEHRAARLRAASAADPDRPRLRHRRRPGRRRRAPG